MSKTLGTIKKFFILLYHFLLIFTQSKSFIDNKVIGSPTLNMLGLHVFRILITHCVARLKWILLKNLITRERRDSFHKNGFLVIENIFPTDIFNEVCLKAKQIQDDDYSYSENNESTFTKQMLLSQSNCEKFFGIDLYSFLKNNPSLNNSLKYVAANKTPPFIHFLNIIHGENNEGDPQKHFHSDAFFPSMKAWIFLKEVTPEEGPFVYIPESNRLTLARLRLEYQKSIQCAKREETIYQALRGSFRYSESDIQSLNLPEPKSFCVKGNTLVIANMFGIHKRGNSTNKVSRTSLWFYSRLTPFLPFTGINSTIYDKIQNRMAEKRTYKKLTQ